MRVQDVMTVDVATVRRETALKDAARALAERRISGMPVVDDAHAVVGVLSEADVLGKERTDTTEDDRAEAWFPPREPGGAQRTRRAHGPRRDELAGNHRRTALAAGLRRRADG